MYQCTDLARNAILQLPGACNLANTTSLYTVFGSSGTPMERSSVGCAQHRGSRLYGDSGGATFGGPRFLG